MVHELPKLPFATDALEPYISKRTLEFHYGKHHQAYVNNLNKLIQGTEFENKSLEDIVKSASGGIFNNGAQVWNHTFYWNCMKPQGGGDPSGELLDELTKSFGSISGFKEKFSTAAATLFGSGWAWLVRKSDGSLEIVQESNAGNPLRNGLTPIMTCDVWEHAYYLDKMNARPDYIADFWKLVDWDKVGGRL
ncbi:MAG: superoxide dismutase [Bacteroidia bacterium]|nr:superoxide dismutase [Bacteroidia bacterium]